MYMEEWERVELPQNCPANCRELWGVQRGEATKWWFLHVVNLGPILTFETAFLFPVRTVSLHYLQHPSQIRHCASLFMSVMGTALSGLSHQAWSSLLSLVWVTASASCPHWLPNDPKASALAFLPPPGSVPWPNLHWSPFRPYSTLLANNIALKEKKNNSLKRKTK